MITNGTGGGQGGQGGGGEMFMPFSETTYCLTFDRRPHPYRVRDRPRSEASTSPWSVVAVSPDGLAV